MSDYIRVLIAGMFFAALVVWFRFDRKAKLKAGCECCGLYHNPDGYVNCNGTIRRLYKGSKCLCWCVRKERRE
jgi:hypothetical protein